MASYVEKLREQRRKEKLAREYSHIPQEQFNNPVGDAITQWGSGVKERIGALGRSASTLGDLASWQQAGRNLGEVNNMLTADPTLALDANPITHIAGLAGMIKSFGKLKKRQISPDGVETIKGFTDKLPKSKTYDSVGNIYEDMYAQVRPTTSGEFLARYIAPRLSKSKNIYAIGDDPEELARFILDKKNRSDKAILAAENAKYKKSLAGQLEEEFGDVFEYAKSRRSKSEYITHKPSGTKIRISDHDLPLRYEGADLDIPINATTEEKLRMIMNYLR